MVRALEPRPTPIWAFQTSIRTRMRHSGLPDNSNLDRRCERSVPSSTTRWALVQPGLRSSRAPSTNVTPSSLSNIQAWAKVVKHLRNLYCLKWLRPCVVFSRHANLQEKLLGDLWPKVLWGLQMQTSVCILAIAHGNIKSMENAPTVGNALHPKPPEAYTISHVMCLIVIASTWVNLNDVLQRASKNTLVRWQSFVINLYCFLTAPQPLLLSLTRRAHPLVLWRCLSQRNSRVKPATRIHFFPSWPTRCVLLSMTPCLPNHLSASLSSENHQM